MNPRSLHGWQATDRALIRARPTARLEKLTVQTKGEKEHPGSLNFFSFILYI